MEQLGQTVSSDQNIYINFRSVENISDIPEEFEIKPEIFQKNLITEDIIEQKIFAENSMPYILMKSNLCERPIKLFIDTGAAVSIIANDVVKNEVIKENYILNLFGIAGKEISIKTQGMIHNTFLMGNISLQTKLHIVDRKYIGPSDGYLGFDFLAPYKVNIDLNEMILTINLKKLMKLNQNENDELNNEPKNGHSNEEIEENFLNIFGQYYDFEPERHKRLKKNQRNKIILNDPIQDKFDPKECQRNKFFKINTCPIDSITKNGYTIKKYYAKSILNNSEPFPIINTEKYKYSSVCGKTPHEKIENVDVSTLTNKYCSQLRTKMETPQVFENCKNIDSNTTSVYYFKDYG